jgi:hypothetical protein
MIPTGEEDRNTRRKNSPSTTTSITNKKWTGLGSKPDLLCQKMANNAHAEYTALNIHRVSIKSFPDYKQLLQENQGKTL